MTSSKEGNLWDDRGSHRTADFIDNAILNFVCVSWAAWVEGTPIASKASLKLHQDDLIVLADTFFLGFDTFFMSVLISISMVEKVDAAAAS